MCRIAAQYDTAQSPFVAESSGEIERAASNDLDTVLWELDIMLETTILVIDLFLSHTRRRKTSASTYP